MARKGFGAVREKDDRSFSNEVLRRLKESVAKDGIVCPE